MKSPLFIIAAIFVIFFIVIAIFPNWLTPYSFEELSNYLPGSWDPPSIDHPLGTAIGRDVLGLTIWGIRDALIFGFGAVLLGLLGGILFGFIKWISLFIKQRIKSSDEQLHLCRSTHRVTMGSVIIFSVFPGIIIVLLLNIILGDCQISYFETRGNLINCKYYYWVSLSTIGILLIPIFTSAVCNAISGELNLNKIGKAIIIHIPLGFAIAILIYEIIGYLGFAPSEIYEIHLGYNILGARFHLDTSPLASFSPGIVISCIIISFFLLYIALQDYSSDFRE